MPTTVTIEEFINAHCVESYAHVNISFGTVLVSLYGAGSPVGLRLASNPNAVGHFFDGRYYGVGPSEEYRVLTKKSDTEYDFMGTPVEIITNASMRPVLCGAILCDEMWTTGSLNRRNYAVDTILPIYDNNGEWVLSQLRNDCVMVVGNRAAMEHDVTVGMTVGTNR